MRSVGDMKLPMLVSGTPETVAERRLDRVSPDIRGLPFRFTEAEVLSLHDDR